ncbi:unnamed protein product [Peniophora sp. CBMAI 1063]|nr:unnamed protein product [Peniophora sp. CBMAI 1063]
MSHSSGAMMSNVGNPQVYNDGDQRPSKKEIEEAQNHPAYHAGEKHSHQDLDPKDSRSIANRLNHASKHQGEDEEDKTVHDPLKPAQDQGHEPSRGAQIDKELQEEDEAILRKKGIKH